VLAVFSDIQISLFFDGTVGAGGHAKALLEAHPEIERYIGCDRDPDALEIAARELAKWQKKVELVHGSYSEIHEWLKKDRAQGVLIDAGVSSMQLDRKERGFSFQGQGPLDMRMDPSAEVTAAEVVNRWREEDLARILYEYGEEPRARKIARAICEARRKKPIRTTQELVEVLGPVMRRRGHLHPATLVFQALRIAVNDELKELEKGTERGIEALGLMGKMAVISFHRLEDRIVKQCFRKEEHLTRKGLETGCLKILTKKPLVPSLAEIRENPRCRSAKLRAVQKVAA
jgi:16S rRNA (cytosine1402-N4)-methyltransferase